MRKRVLIVNPYLLPTNGGNGLGAWVCQALHADYDVTLLARHRPDLSEVNRSYGTSLAAHSLHVEVFEDPRWLRALPFRLTLIRAFLLARAARAMAPRFDIVFSTDDETDVGERGIQYIHFPKFLLPRPSTEPPRWFDVLPVLRAYYRASAWLTGFSMPRMRRNRTLVNSHWTGRHVWNTHHIHSTTVYPPASGSFDPVDWNERERGFVLISRMHPDKRIELAIDIVQQLRSHGHALTLRIVAAADDEAYGERIRAIVANNASWITLDANVSRGELARIATTRQFGIHAAAEEHFGMSVAELVRAGCVVFVPRGGGQVEIVGEDDRLTYVDAADAFAKIDKVLTEPQTLSDVRAMLDARRQMFSPEQFVTAIRAVVAE